MKKIVFAVILFVLVSGICFAQEQNNSWRGTVRFNIADNLINLHNALAGIYITWTNYIMPNIGIPAEIDINFGWGVLPGVQISLLSGAEYIITGYGNNELNGIFFDAKIGLSIFINEGAKVFFISKANAGYQLITKGGFVFTPAAGVVYNGRSGFGLNIMFDIGFAY